MYERAHSPAAHHGDRLFFIECDRKGRLDRLMEMASSGGPVRSLAEFEHAPGSRCEYSSLAADEGEVRPRDGGELRSVATFRIIDPLAENPGDEGLVGFAVDEECAYLARVRTGRAGTELLAVAK